MHHPRLNALCVPPLPCRRRRCRARADPLLAAQLLSSLPAAARCHRRRRAPPLPLHLAQMRGASGPLRASRWARMVGSTSIICGIGVPNLEWIN